MRGSKLPGSFSLKTVLSTLKRDDLGAVTPPKRLHLVIHLDLNKTIIMADAVQGKTFEGVANDMLTESIWGRAHPMGAKSSSENPLNTLNSEQWKPDLTQPIGSLNPRPDWIGTSKELICYADWIRKHLSYHGGAVVPEIKARRKLYNLSFTDEGRAGQDYRPVYSHILSKFQESHPKIMIPAFYTLINSLCRFQMAHSGWFSFSIVFRSFGTDIEDVTNELNEYCAERGLDGSQPGVPDLRVKPENTGFITRRYQRDSSQSPCVLFIGEGARERHAFDKSKPGKVTKKQLDQRAGDLIDRYEPDESVLVCDNLESMYSLMRSKWLSQQTMAIGDDWIWWASHGECSEGGKLLLIDSEEPEIQHVFFDDNIMFDEPYIVDVRELKDPSHSPLGDKKWDDYKNKLLVKAEPLEATLDDEYFVDWISHCVFGLENLAQTK